MGKVLMLSYWFPPAGGAGTQRIAKACKYLPAEGWEPAVLAGVPLPDKHAPFSDDSLSADVAGVRTERVPHRPRSFKHTLLRASRFRLDLDAWVERATPVALELAKSHRADAILTSLSPFAGWRLGRDIGRRLGIPWIADLRDPWALDGWRSWPSPLHVAWDLNTMRRALTAADAVIANVPAAAHEYQRLGVRPENLCVIPNGFDEEDFDGAPAERRGGSTFTITHVGTLHRADVASGLTRNSLRRWRNRQIAPLGRSGYYLLHAIRILRERAPQLTEGLELHLHGRVAPSNAALARELGLSGILVEKGYSPHREAVAALRSADASFVPLHGIAPGERALVVPGKLYEALASGPPVLAALPPGDGADLVELLGAGRVAPPCDSAALADALEGIIHEVRSDRTRPRSRPARLLPFERRRLTSRLAEVLERVTGGASLAGIPDPWSEASSGTVAR